MRKESRPNSHKGRQVRLIWNKTTNEMENKNGKKCGITKTQRTVP